MHNIQGKGLFQVSDITLCGTAPSCGEKTDILRVKSDNFTRGHSRSDQMVRVFTGVVQMLALNTTSNTATIAMLSCIWLCCFLSNSFGDG